MERKGMRIGIRIGMSENRLIMKGDGTTEQVRVRSQKRNRK